MFVKRAAGSVTDFANVAMVIAIAEMFATMFIKRDLVLIGQITNVASERSTNRFLRFRQSFLTADQMFLFMRYQRFHQLKSFVTIVTTKRFMLVMTSHMTVQLFLRFESLLTDVTYVRHIMPQHVKFQLPFRAVFIIAHRARYIAADRALF